MKRCVVVISGLQVHWLKFLFMRGPFFGVLKASVGFYVICTNASWKAETSNTNLRSVEYCDFISTDLFPSIARKSGEFFRKSWPIPRKLCFWLDRLETTRDLEMAFSFSRALWLIGLINLGVSKLVMAKERLFTTRTTTRKRLSLCLYCLSQTLTRVHWMASTMQLVYAWAFFWGFKGERRILRDLYQCVLKSRDLEYEST